LFYSLRKDGMFLALPTLAAWIRFLHLFRSKFQRKLRASKPATVSGASSRHFRRWSLSKPI